jgi:hypothetical protein
MCSLSPAQFVAGWWQTRNASIVDSFLLLLNQMINWLADDLMKKRGATLDPITEPVIETACLQKSSVA